MRKCEFCEFCLLAQGIVGVIRDCSLVNGDRFHSPACQNDSAFCGSVVQAVDCDCANLPCLSLWVHPKSFPNGLCHKRALNLTSNASKTPSNAFFCMLFKSAS